MLKQYTKYEIEKKRFRKEARRKFIDDVAHKLGLHFHWIRDLQIKKILDQNLAPYTSTVTERIAFVVNEEVVEVMFCQPKLAAILLSNPTILDVSSDKLIRPGYKYKNNKFIA